MSEENVIRVERLLAHAPAVVWRALTEPAQLARWWAEGDVRPVVGHRFDLDVGAFGKQACEVLAVEPGALLRYRFSTNHLDTVITWAVVPEGQGTRLILTHEGFNLDSPMGQQALAGMRRGWPGVLGRLAVLLDG